MAIHLSAHSRDPGELCRLERYAFAAKIRLTRAVLGWSRSELGSRVGLTPLETIWREQNIEFEDFSEGGFGVNIRSAVIESSRSAQVRRVSQ